MYSDIVLKAKKYIIGLLAPLKEKGYTFHNLDHTLEVFNRVTYLGQKEGLNEEMLEMLQLAALFHDTGFIKQYDNNEPIGAEIAEKWLKEQNYPEDKIDIVKKIILATIPSFDKPDNLPFKIIKDSDLDNLGTPDFFENTINLYYEFSNIKGSDFNPYAWFEGGKKFILSCKFYTQTQQKERGKQLEINKSVIDKKINDFLKKIKS